MAHKNGEATIFPIEFSDSTLMLNASLNSKNIQVIIAETPISNHGSGNSVKSPQSATTDKPSQPQIHQLSVS
jgi:hypothetical protein